jgi:hypothetical protein
MDVGYTLNACAAVYSRHKPQESIIMRNALVCRSLVIIGVFALASVARAEAQTQPDYGDFAKGHWELSLYAGYEQNFSSEPKIGYGAIGAGYFLFDGFSVNAEARYYRSGQDGPDTNVYDLNIQIRQHIYTAKNWSLFIDASAGVSEADHRFPPGGTNFNFIEETGIGATYRLSDHCHLIGGIRYFHVSNAHLHGADENPSLNGIAGYVGLMWTF